jgi:hypothetical protein
MPKAVLVILMVAGVDSHYHDTFPQIDRVKVASISLRRVVAWVRVEGYILGKQRGHGRLRGLYR